MLAKLIAAASLALLGTSLVSMLANASDRGSVTLEGRILDSACALEVASADQTVRMTPVSMGPFIRSAESEAHFFALRLVNCTLTHPYASEEGGVDVQRLRVTFDGPGDREGRYFAVSGEAKGLALSIVDAGGRDTLPGIPMIPFAEAGQIFRYSLRLVSNSSNQVITAGAYQAAIRLKLDYH